MRIVDIIEKKRDGRTLTQEEIQFFIQTYVEGQTPDYQASALLMAIVLQGMTDRETRDLTLAMAHSGELLNLDDVASFVVDKHSTGGVGDKVSLVIGPTVAACGLPVGKMSGRGLGFSGGTLDKLESIAGFRTDLNVKEFKAQIQDIGLVITGQSANLAPADGKLYALRDVTGTVPSLPLIVSSIMSKKIAAGAHAIVLDVKVGTGAFMKTLKNAQALAQSMVHIGQSVGRHVVARISDMNQPLGQAVGNALEVREAIATLHNQGPEDFTEHCLDIAGEMLVLGSKANTKTEGYELAKRTLASGQAGEKFRQMVEAQGGDVHMVDNPDTLPTAPLTQVTHAPKGGYLASVQADEIGLAVVDLGGGREKKGDSLDHRVGVVLYVQVGDQIQEGQPLFTIHAENEAKQEQAARRVLGALKFSDTPVEPLPLFYERIV